MAQKTPTTALGIINRNTWLFSIFSSSIYNLKEIWITIINLNYLISIFFDQKRFLFHTVSLLIRNHLYFLNLKLFSISSPLLKRRPKKLTVVQIRRKNYILTNLANFQKLKFNSFSRTFGSAYFVLQKTIRIINNLFSKKNVNFKIKNIIILNKKYNQINIQKHIIILQNKYKQGNYPLKVYTSSFRFIGKRFFRTLVTNPFLNKKKEIFFSYSWKIQQPEPLDSYQVYYSRNLISKKFLQAIKIDKKLYFHRVYKIRLDIISLRSRVKKFLIKKNQIFEEQRSFRFSNFFIFKQACETISKFPTRIVIRRINYNATPFFFFKKRVAFQKWSKKKFFIPTILAIYISLVLGAPRLAINWIMCLLSTAKYQSRIIQLYSTAYNYFLVSQKYKIITNNNCRGVRLEANGKIDGRDRSVTYKLQIGAIIPCGLKTPIASEFSSCSTIYGVIGIFLWYLLKPTSTSLNFIYNKIHLFNFKK